MMWRLTKWKASRLSRAATGGLAASDRMMPPSMRPNMAARTTRSTVHHQSPKGVRTVRETMPAPRPALVLTRHGCQEVNAGEFGRNSRAFALLPDRSDPGQRQHQFAEPVAAHLEIPILVERRTGRRQQHHRLLQSRALRIPGC